MTGNWLGGKATFRPRVVAVKLLSCRPISGSENLTLAWEVLLQKYCAFHQRQVAIWD